MCHAHASNAALAAFEVDILDRVAPTHRIELAQTRIESPLGELRVAATRSGIVKVGFPTGPRSDFNAWLMQRVPGAERVETVAVLEEACLQLRAYFAGGLREFKLPLDLRGSDFQLRVWEALARIPFGETRTYGEIAAALGRPGASRAVGAASGANPLPIVLPCHRVVAASGRLGGFGGGLAAKRFLLAFECGSLPALTPS